MRRITQITFGCAVAGALAAYACAPMLTSAFLLEPEEILHAAERWLKFDVRALKRTPPVPKALASTVKKTDNWKSPIPSTLDVDVDDLRAALTKPKMHAKDRESILSQYRELRQEQLWFWTDHDRFTLPRSVKSGLYFGQNAPVTHDWISKHEWPASVPEEFRLYAEGADHFYHHRTADARKSWTALLALPEEQRRWRSLWAAWMLYKTAATPKAASSWLSEVCRLRETEGQLDSLRMHPAALALLEVSSAKPDPLDGLAIQYQNTKANGRSHYYEALNDKITSIFARHDDTLLVRAAGDAGLRELLTVWLCSRSVNLENGRKPRPEELGHIDSLERWCSAIETAGARNEPLLGELAISLYQNGRYELARKIIPRGATTWESQWVWSKLDLLRGDLKAASAHTATALRLFPAKERRDLKSVTESVYDPPYIEEGRHPDHDRLVRNSRFLAECATVRLANSDFTAALRLFIEADCPHDAAYVIEQLLTPDEVVVFARDYHRGKESAAPTPTAPSEDVFSILNKWYDERSPKDRLLYVAARRLARERYFKNARDFYPPVLLPFFDRYVILYRRAVSSAIRPEVRAECLMEVARIHRWLGMELFGAEGAPDATRWDGAYSASPLPEVRESLSRGMLLTLDDQSGYWGYHERKPVTALPPLVGAEESRRLKQNPLWGAERFHYRYVAAEFAWQAAHLLPKDSNIGASMLGEAGTWIDVRSPLEADRFYKEMVWRFFDTPIAREADKLRWFPNSLRERPPLEELLQRPIPGDVVEATR